MSIAGLRSRVSCSRRLPTIFVHHKISTISAPTVIQQCLYNRTVSYFRAYSTKPGDAGTPSVPPSDFQVAATDVQHAEFVSQAKAQSCFEVSDRDKDGNSQGKLPEDEGVTRMPDGAEGEAGTKKQPDAANTGNGGPQSGTFTGKLSPTSSHLFKLIVPLPPSLHAALGLQKQDSTASPPPKVIDTAFLLHPSQPLSHVSRLILGSLPAAEREADVEFRAVSGRDHDAYPTSQGTEEADQSTDNEGGPLLYERNPDGQDLQEVRWSTSTDLGDFIKQATLAQHFRIVLKPSWESGMANSTSLLKDRVSTPKAVGSGSDKNSASQVNSASKVTANLVLPELSLKIMIPSFDSRTRFLRKRLLYLTREIAGITQKKKELDKAAHKGAQRIAVGGLMGLVGYWGVVFKLTFFSPLGWDVMEPVTYLSGLSTLICSYLFFLYHNREVSYSSILDLSVSARQKALYEKSGLDIERWTEMVSEAKSLRREIQRVAQDYDLEWQGQLENLEPTSTETGKSNKSASRPASTTAAPSVQTPTSTVVDGSQTEPSSLPTSRSRSDGTTHTASNPETSSGALADDGAKGKHSINVDATINEAVELEEQTRAKEKQRRHGTGGKGEVLEADKQQGEDKAKKFAGHGGAD